MRVLLRWLGLRLTLAGAKLLSAGNAKQHSCIHCSAPTCLACGLYSREVAAGATFCSTKCSRTPVDKRRTTAMLGGRAVEDVVFL